VYVYAYTHSAALAAYRTYSVLQPYTQIITYHHVCVLTLCFHHIEINKQWLLPSDSQRKVSILDAAKLSLEQAEDSRNACRQQWSMLCLQVCIVYNYLMQT
jgi:hypothetical protein